MKKFAHRYRISKFKRFTNGLLFAVISTIALFLCISEFYDQTNSEIKISFTFSIAIISFLMGLVSMFGNHEEPKKI